LRNPIELEGGELAMAGRELNIEIANRRSIHSPKVTRALLILCASLAMIFSVGCGTTSSGKSGSSGGSGGGSGGSGSGSNSGVVISPAGANVRIGDTQPFSAAVTGAPNNDVTWSVNNMAAGDATTGTISNSGVYAAPAELPNPNSVTIAAVPHSPAA
jgi:hypothetical protein